MVRVPRFDLEAMNYDSDADGIAAESNTDSSSFNPRAQPFNSKCNKAPTPAHPHVIAEHQGGGGHHGMDAGISAQPGLSEASQESEKVSNVWNNLTTMNREELREMRQSLKAATPDQGHVVTNLAAVQGFVPWSKPPASKPKNLDLGSGGQAFLHGCTVSSTPRSASPISSPRGENKKKKKYNTPVPHPPALFEHDVQPAGFPGVFPPTCSAADPAYVRPLPPTIYSYKEQKGVEELEKELEFQPTLVRTLFCRDSKTAQQLVSHDEAIRDLRSELVRLHSSSSNAWTANAWNQTVLSQALETVNVLSKSLTSQQGDYRGLEKTVDEKISVLTQQLEELKTTMMSNAEAEEEKAGDCKPGSSESADDSSNGRYEQEIATLHERCDDSSYGIKGLNRALENLKAASIANKVFFKSEIEDLKSGISHNKDNPVGKSSETESAIKDLRSELGAKTEALKARIKGLTDGFLLDNRAMGHSMDDLKTDTKADFQELEAQVKDMAAEQVSEKQQVKAAIEELKTELRAENDAVRAQFQTIAEGRKFEKLKTESAIKAIGYQLRAENDALRTQLAGTAEDQKSEKQERQSATEAIEVELEKVCMRLRDAEKESRDAKTALADALRRIESLEQAGATGRSKTDTSPPTLAFCPPYENFPSVPGFQYGTYNAPDIYQLHRHMFSGLNSNGAYSPTDPRRTQLGPGLGGGSFDGPFGASLGRPTANAMYSNMPLPFPTPSAPASTFNGWPIPPPPVHKGNTGSRPPSPGVTANAGSKP